MVIIPEGSWGYWSFQVGADLTIWQIWQMIDGERKVAAIAFNQATADLIMEKLNAQAAALGE